ncbi:MULTISPECIES: class I SAM-dependent methyltransferase [Erysipelothrix]|uniref:Methyltransferase domain-containing protein n=1 Tax=Erysipelothrix piscisicarius TaxID=2485784 RepID=A0A3S8RNM4_9FIRM|nr:MULTISPECIES: class I SAM-dependent methyltransferase [Erysipelothrix]AZK44502.1 methyltransferase domain-containing protein [Erysipelothrix piscisicarius]MBK2401795.1 methyltransferase domain-containing protein [Erysipelothrix sp. strain 2 (EsS2-6-Brazil)]MBK2404065.1 methyltransferase domain-containing protein [Erysipelothrix sp. strain 2 (EsS2-7-Brazil)]NBA00883.1 methyltransferase domain-containing protein [Erysipelothrix rhusiopathiae]
MNHKEQSHKWMQQFLNNDAVVVDMTCGNGYDTQFLASQAGHVYAIDIQEEAIESAKKLNQGSTNITYIHSDHSRVNFKEKAPFTGAIYNLGYLPRSDKSIITTSHTTVASLKIIIPLLTDFLVIACYLKHEGGYEEYVAVRDYIVSTHLPYETLEYETPLSPITFLVDLRNNAS